MFPREHGAWSLLVTPFVAALLLAGRVNWTVGAALCTVLAMFLLRAPLVTLARQRWVWRDRRAESDEARRWVLWLGPCLAVFGGWLLLEWGWAAVWMGAAALGLTAGAVWMTARNRQRSAWFQGLSSAGLAFSAVAAARAAMGHFPLWGWVLWGLCGLHGACGVLVVHARLNGIVSRKRGEATGTLRRTAWVGLWVSGLAAVLVLMWKPWVAAAPVLATLAQGMELRYMDLDAPLRRVGLRAMTVSIVHALMLVLALR
jgi:hypothetical protein